MKLYSYYLLRPLDWEFCYYDIDDYKKKLEEQHNPYAGDLSTIFAQIDEMLAEAQNHFSKEFSRRNAKLRCPPMIFPLPSGYFSGTSTFCIILKRDDDGDTYVYSTVPLSYLES